MRSVRLSFYLFIFYSLSVSGLFSQTVPAGYTVSLLNGSIPATKEIYEMTIDQVSGNIYFAGYNTTGNMDRIQPNGTYTSMSTTWASAVNYWHPYYSTDIEFYNGA